MKSRSIQLLARGFGLAAGAAGATAIALALWLPLEDSSVAIPKVIETNSPKKSPATLSLDDLQQVWKRNWSGEQVAGDNSAGPLIASSANAALPFTFAGTVGDSIALLRLPDGSIEVKSVGETLMGVQVLSVADGKIELKMGGAKYLLLKPVEDGN